MADGRNVEVTWLTGRLVPDHKTIAEFRRTTRTARHSLIGCRRTGLLKGDCVVVDGEPNSRPSTTATRTSRRTRSPAVSTIWKPMLNATFYEMVCIDRQEEGEAGARKVLHLARRYGRIRGSSRG